MRIGVDATCWMLPRGFGRHARGLLTALRTIDRENDYTFFTDSPDAMGALAAIAPIADVRLVTTATPTLSAAAAGRRRSLADLLAMSRALSDRTLDLLLFPTVFTYVPVMSRARKLMMIHDVTGERYPELTHDSRRARLLWRIKGVLARRQADAVATVSAYSRRALAAEFGIDERAIHVVGEAADPIFRRLDDPRPTARLVALELVAPRRRIVYVGGFSHHKNLPMLVETFGHLAGRQDLLDVDLVLVGDTEHETFFSNYREVRERVRTLGLEARVVFTGFLADEDLVVLLNRATVLALPSLMEGFGLPAIEAAACGCPVIATTESALPEILGDAAVFVDPTRADDLRDALNKVLTSPERQAHMRRAGLEAAARLTWDQAARDLLKVMQRTVAS